MKLGLTLVLFSLLAGEKPRPAPFSPMFPYKVSSPFGLPKKLLPELSSTCWL